MRFLDGFKRKWSRPGREDCEHHQYTSNFHQNRSPIVLRTPCLLAFSGLAIALCLSVILLWQLSRDPSKLQITGVNSYILTYGPTAILIWLVAFWRQVDHHVKESAPWNEIYTGPCPAKKSVLVDYISVFELSALCSAIRNRHFPIVASTLGFACLKVAVLSSTGLLLVETYDVQHNTTTNLQSNFIGRRFDVGNNTALFDKSLLYTTYGLLAQNMTAPFGIGTGLAYATFDQRSGLTSSADTIVQADGFLPSFQCRAAEVKANLPSVNDTDAFPETMVQLDHPDCLLGLQDVALHTLNPRIYRSPPRQLSGLMRSINCSNAVFDNKEGTDRLFVMADFRYSQVVNSSADSAASLGTSIKATSWVTEVAQISGIVCRLSYAIGKVTVSTARDDPQDIKSARSFPDESERGLDSLSNDDLDQLFRASISASDQMLGDRTDEGYALEYPDPMLKLMALTARGSYEQLLDSSTMAEAAIMVSKQLAAQIAHQYLRSNDSSVIGMQVSAGTIHLKVTDVSTYVVLAALGLSAVTCLWLLFLLRDYTSTSCQRSLLCAASLLRHDSSTAEDLVKSQFNTENQIHQALGLVNVYVADDNDGQAELHLQGSSAFPTEPVNKACWWNPCTVSKLSMAITFFSTISIIVMLEILQRTSDRYNGFATLPSDSTAQIVYAHYLPALIVLILTSLYNCLDFNALLLSPFHAMSKSVRAQELSDRPLLGQVPVVALLRCAQKRWWGATSSSLAALVGSVLAIVVSGLLDVRDMYSTELVSITASDVLVPGWSDSALHDGGAALTSSLNENVDLPYPPGTFNDIAYPSLKLSDPFKQIENPTISVNLPAWRAHLQCEQLSKSSFQVTSAQSRFQNTVTVNATYDLPAICMFGGPNGSDATLNFVNTFNLPTTQNTTYIGKFLDIHVGPYDPILGGSQGERVPSAMRDNPLGCPTISLTYGYVDLQVEDPKELADAVSVEICYQQIQSVQTTLTFSDAEFSLDADNPPKIDETSAKFLNVNETTNTYEIGTGTATAFPFRLESHFDQEFAMFNNTNDNIFSDLSDLGDTVDPFFQGVLFGRTPVPFTSLRQETPDQIKQIQTGILLFYRRYMAQAISLNMRQPAGASSPETTFTGNAPSAIVTKRILQHKTSKLVLQCMLGFMLICGIFTVSTVRLHNLLPASANPCTIWGQMSLWAGSSIYERKDGMRADLVDGEKGQDVDVVARLTDPDSTELFKLGWWDMPDGKQRYGIDVVRDVQA